MAAACAARTGLALSWFDTATWGAHEYRPEQRLGEGGGKQDEGEDIEVVELGYDAALARLAAGDIADMKTVVLLQYLQLHLMQRA